MNNNYENYNNGKARISKPDWFRVPANSGRQNEEVMSILRNLSLNTVCEQASCPNCGECFGQRTATFMILGNQCTRRCTFCAVSKGSPQAVDLNEPVNLAKAVRELGLNHVVITSVTRDDLSDGGAGQFASVINAVRSQTEGKTTIEVLIPDLQGNWENLDIILAARPDVLNHNLETIPRLYDKVRPQAIYERSLELLNYARKSEYRPLTKSGIMLGLGETIKEVESVLNDLRSIHCDLLTIGQYLAPSKKHFPVFEYIHPDEFKKLEEYAYKIGFKHVSSGPLVRSSYHASKALTEVT